MECWVDLDVDNEVPRGIEAADTAGLLLVSVAVSACAMTTAVLVLLVLSWTA